VSHPATHASRENILARPNDGTVTVAAYRLPCGCLVVSCPFCHGRHVHGAPGPRVGSGDGLRVSHCAGGATRHPYSLWEVPGPVPSDLQPRSKSRKPSNAPGSPDVALRGAHVGQPSLTPRNRDVGAAGGVARFAAEHCRFDPTATVASGEVYAAYAGWCDRHGERPLCPVWLGRGIARLGFRPHKSRGVRCWRGLALVVGAAELEACRP